MNVRLLLPALALTLLPFSDAAAQHCASMSDNGDGCTEPVVLDSCTVGCDSCSSAGCDSCSDGCFDCGGCCEAPFRIQVASLLMDRSSPDRATLVSRQSDGLVLMDAGNFNFDWEVGVDASVIFPMNASQGIEARYLWTGDHVAQQSYAIPTTNIIIHTDPVTFFGGNIGGDATLESTLHSFEMNVRQPKCTGLELFYGFRYVALTEESLALSLPFNGGAESVSVTAANHLLGLQLGVEQRTRLGALNLAFSGRAGVFNNDVDTRFVVDRLGSGDDVDVDASSSRDDIAFVGELALNGILPVTQNASLVFGYQALWVEGVAQAADQLGATESFNVGNGTTIDSDVDYSGIFYHGARAGVEVLW